MIVGIVHDTVPVPLLATGVSMEVSNQLGSWFRTFFVGLSSSCCCWCCCCSCSCSCSCSCCCCCCWWWWWWWYRYCLVLHCCFPLGVSYSALGRLSQSIHHCARCQVEVINNAPSARGPRVQQANRFVATSFNVFF